MRILCVVPYYQPAYQYGGPIVSVHGLNRALTEIGLQVDVYTTMAGLSKEIDANRATAVDGVKVSYFELAGGRAMRGLRSWFYSPRLMAALKENIGKYDLVYINIIWSFPAFIAAHYCRKHSIPYIVASRGMLYDYTMGKKAWKKWPYYHLLARRDIRKACAIHYTTRDEAERCHNRLGLTNTALVIPNGLDIKEYLEASAGAASRFLGPELSSKKIILFVGRIHWIKGLDILVDAYGRLLRERDDTHLVIAGPDSDGYARSIKARLAAAGAGDRTTFTGLVRGEDKVQLYRHADMFILPSYSENFGVSVIEAMACGLPVIVTRNVGLSREVAESSCGIVVSADAEDLYQAMQRMLDDPNGRAAMGEKGKRAVVERFTWGRIADSFKDGVQSVLDAREK